MTDKALQPGPLARLRNWFLAGIVVTAPLAITVYLTIYFIEAVDRNVDSLLPPELKPSTYLPFQVPGLGLIIALVTLTVIGFLATNFLGRSVIGIGERLVARMPLVRGLYSALKQLFETLLSQSGNSYRQVVLVPFPRAGSWAIAFVTTEQTGEVGRAIGEDDLIGVYVPTTPNPTGGYLIYVRRSEVIPLKMTVEEGMKVVISTGVVQAPDATEARIDRQTPSEAA